MPFKGHTPRQHRATSAKGGRTRIRKVTRAQQIAWGKKGGQASVQARYAKEARRLMGCE